jgi:hypothetical protein
MHQPLVVSVVQKMWKFIYITKFGINPHPDTRTVDDAMANFRVTSKLVTAADNLRPHIMFPFRVFTTFNNFNNVNRVLWTYVI